VKYLVPLLGLLAVACTMPWSPPSEPIPQQLVPAPSSPAGRLVIVLPGLGNSMRVLQESGIAAAIQRGMPDADVMLALASVRYYLDGGMPRRVHDQVVVPARARGYREIWLAGASMGGGGVTMYEREYPGEMTGLVLLAPYMGTDSLLEEIRKAGGLASWNPGPPPAAIDGFNIAREQWRTLQAWSKEPARTRNVWLTCGTKDSLLPAAELIAQLLPADHFLKTDGIHDWTAWLTPTTTIFTKITATDSAASISAPQ
jgi:pimeloyl-ACP methyl ester carboxylesterase